MTQTKRTQRKIFGTLLVSVLLFVSPIHANDYGDARAELVATYSDSNFVPEGIALDDGHVFLGSIRTGRIIHLKADPEIVTDRENHWSVFGMRFHPDGSLWFASAAVPQLIDVGEDEGKTGLFRLDVSTGKITQAAVLPQIALLVMMIGPLLLLLKPPPLRGEVLSNTVVQSTVTVPPMLLLMPPPHRLFPSTFKPDSLPAIVL